MIRLQNIYKFFNEGKPNEKVALCDVSLTIEDGEFVAIQGKSGAGKTTLLNLVGCLDVPTRGYCVINEKITADTSPDTLARLRHDVLGIVTQNPFLIGNASALENVMLPLYLNKISSEERIARATEALKNVGLIASLKQKISTMSGGEQQRVTIARALVNNPSIILADEPTGALDTENAEIILAMLEKINVDGKTVIIVTHDNDVAARCNRIITLSDGKIFLDTKKA